MLGFGDLGVWEWLFFKSVCKYITFQKLAKKSRNRRFYAPPPHFLLKKVMKNCVKFIFGAVAFIRDYGIMFLQPNKKNPNARQARVPRVTQSGCREDKQSKLA